MKKTLLLGISIAVAAAVGSAAAEEMASKMVPNGDLDWVPMAEGSPIMAVTLWGDEATGPYGALLRLPAGTEVPMHAHDGDYNGINLQGTWRRQLEGGEWMELPPNSYVFQQADQMHADTCVGPEDCVIFVTQDVGRSFIPKDQ